jgi:tetratricopeptide (TPR) repeat protein
MQEPHIGRNSPCPCGSGKKYKRCCGGMANLSSLRERGIAAAKAGNFTEAVKIFRQAAADSPASADAWLNLGNAHQGLRDTREAIKCYSRAIGLMPELPVARYNLGVALEAIGDTKAAIDSYREALRLKPDYVEASYNLAGAFDSLQRFEEAVQWYRKTLELRADHANAHFNLGVALTKLGRGHEAIDSYRRALDYQPDALDVLVNLGDLFSHAAQTDEAKRCYECALRLEPRLARAHFGLGRLLKREGLLDDARTSFAAAIESDASLLDAQHALGMTLIGLGKLSEAVSPLKRALELTRQLGIEQPNSAPNFSMTSQSKLLHDIEQLEYLLTNQKIAPHYSKLVQQYRDLVGRLDDEFAQSHLVTIPADVAKEIAPAYNRLINFYEAPRVGAAINPYFDARAIEKNYRDNAPGITFVDNFLSPEALGELRRFCLDSTIWYNFKYPNGYLGASIDDGFYCALLAQIAEELPKSLPGIFKRHSLTHLWAFKYDSRMNGIDVHADFAAVNVNFWITPDSANLDSESGGLVLWDKEAPADWDFDAYNNDCERIHDFLRASSAKMTKVPYRENRAVIFNSDLFHKTDDIGFAAGYENRRINVTLLYGVREKE